MGFFARTVGSARPADLEKLLADYGRKEFDRSAGSKLEPTTDRFIMSITLPKPDHERLPLIEAIRDAGVRSGGWTSCGAWEVLFADFLSPVPDTILNELSEVRVRFLLTLSRPDIGNFLNTMDMITLKRIDPSTYARLSPF